MHWSQKGWVTARTAYKFEIVKGETCLNKKKFKEKKVSWLILATPELGRQQEKQELTAILTYTRTCLHNTEIN